MCIATTLFYTCVSDVYLAVALESDPGHVKLPQSSLRRLWESSEREMIYIVFAWTAEFAAKISLLFFFKRLVDRLPRMTLYVKCVMGFTTMIWIVLICEPFIICAHFGQTMMSESYMRTLISSRSAEYGQPNATHQTTSLPMILLSS